MTLYLKCQKEKLWLLAAGALIAVAGDIFAGGFAARYEYAQTLSVFSSLIFAFVLLKLTRDILESVETKYMLD